MNHKKEKADQLGFKKAQRLAYEAVVVVGRELQEGMTEIQVARLIGAYLKDHGVRSFFHEPFAWFGDRTRFAGVKKYRDFNPTHRRLQPQDVVILDVAPIVEGYPGDIGYTLSLGKNKELEKAMELLRRLRKTIPGLFKKFDRRGADLWREIDREILAQGYQNIHARYPFSVLGHRVRSVPLSFLSGRTPTPFSLHAFWSILSRGIRPELLNVKHRGGLEGCWAIEPHIGGRGFGAKFEEILVVDSDGAHWLDDQVPHREKQMGST